MTSWNRSFEVREMRRSGYMINCISVVLFCSMTAILLSGCTPRAAEPKLLFEERFDQPTQNNKISQEFLQERGQELLVHVQGHEVEYEVSVIEAGEVLQKLTTMWVRLPPVFMVIPESQDNRELSLQINPLQVTKNAELQIRILAFPSDNAESLIEAYSLYENALEVTESEDQQLWLQRIEGLERAAKLFRNNDEHAKSLWALSLAAMFSYYPVYDNLVAISLAHETAKNALAFDYTDIALFNLSTEGQALIERNPDDEFEETVRKQRLAQRRFKQAMQLAESLGLEFEHAWNANNRGIGYYYLDEFSEAVDWYERALIEADKLADPWFLNLVRGNLVLAREQQGDYDGQLEVLTAINRDLRAQGNANYLVHNLNDIGRLHRLLYQFPESIEALAEAQALAVETDDQESYARAGLWLAMAYRAMGYLERAKEILMDAIPRMELVNNGRLLREAHEVAANMAQRLGRFEIMRAHREAQHAYVSSDANLANWYYNRGMDAIAAGDEDALQWLDEALNRFEAAEYNQMYHLTRLQRCAWVLNNSNQACSAETIRPSFDWLLDHASPSRQLTAREVWVEILQESGQTNPALAEFETIIDELAFYRQNLPGVLGAWFWDRRNEIFERYLGLLLEQDLATGEGVTSLAALNRLRSIGLTTGSSAISAQQSAQIRRLLARRERSDDESGEAISLELDRLLFAARKPLPEEQSSPPGLDPTDVQKNHAVLAFHISNSGAWRWFVAEGKAELTKLGDPLSIKEAVRAVRTNIRVAGYSNLEGDLDRLGAMLLEDLEDRMPGTLHVLSGGILNGVPFDTLRSKGRYLVEDHTVINRMTMSDIGESDKPFTVESVFLAGNPESEGSKMLTSAGEELDSIAAILSSARIHRFEGEELVLSAFESSAFRHSEIVHIASHASLDLKYPELSRILLSSDGNTKSFLTPREIAAINPSATLVVLSACETQGSSDFGWDAGLGFVRELAGVNGRTVIASLWPVGDQFAAQFFETFYEKTAEGMSPSAAFVESKRKLLGQQSVDSWAAFQMNQF